MNNIVTAVIPARIGSTRLQNKLIADIEGVPLIIRTCKAVSNSKLINNIIVATDSDHIKDLVDAYGFQSVITDSSLPSGTDRIFQAVKKMNIDSNYILNVQGDEPLINYNDIDNLINNVIKNNSNIGTMIKRISTLEELSSSSNVKVVINNNMEAIYFSRAVIPFLRDIEFENYLDINKFWKHIGIYLYKKDILEKFVSLPQSKLEILEKLEQLRLIEAGEKFYCYETNNEIIGVDTAEDLEKVREFIQKSAKKRPS